MYKKRLLAVAAAVTMSAVTLQGGASAATITDAPAAPTSLTATVGNKIVYLRWVSPASTATAPNAGIQVFRNGTKVAQLGATATSYTVSGNTLGVLTTYSVKSYNTFGAGDAATISVTPITTPSAVTSISFVKTDTGITLDWSPTNVAAGPVTGYRVARAGMTTVTTTEPTLNVTQAAGTSASYTITPFNTLGTGQAVSKTVTIPGAPKAVSMLRYGSAPGSIVLFWNKIVLSTVAPATSINVYKDGALMANIPATATSYTLKNMLAGQVYDLSLVVVGPLGSSPETHISVTGSSTYYSTR